MAVSLTSQKLEFGPRNVAFNLTLLGDGLGQQTLVKIVDATTLNPVSTKLRVERLSGTVDYGVVLLYWDAQVPSLFAVLSGQIDLDYNRIGGLTNTQAPGFTGSILMSTLSFEAGSASTLLLEMVK
ncbi:MAG: hypothetical protein JWM16_6348 [Verrucomicrobiales bacterium]|nr:hypothetical protein [Verrucomicrobiales bacterium]